MTQKFKRNTNYIAHNRYGIMTGIEFTEFVNYRDNTQIIQLRPTNTKDTSPPCIMEIPSEDLKEFIDNLTKYL